MNHKGSQGTARNHKEVKDGRQPSYDSTVEAYRTPGSIYEREPLPYDLADPLDLAVWTALLVYMDLFHNAGRISPGQPEEEYGEEDEYEAIQYGPYNDARLRPYELEQDLCALAANARARLESVKHPHAEQAEQAEHGEAAQETQEAHRAQRLGYRDGQATAYAVLESLFSPDGSIEGYRVYRFEMPAPQVPAELWKVASEYLDRTVELAAAIDTQRFAGDSIQPAEPEENEGNEGNEGLSGDAGRMNLTLPYVFAPVLLAVHVGDLDGYEIKPAPGSLKPETSTAHRVYRALQQELLLSPLATVVYMARLALGDTLTQSEAARKLGMSPARVKVLVDEKRYRHLRAGRTVLLLADEVLLDANIRQRTRNRSKGKGQQDQG